MANKTQENEILIYYTEEGDVRVSVVFQDETFWLTQKAMAELFGVQTPSISKHLKNIFQEGELEQKVVVSKMETTTSHGAIPDKTQTKETQFYNLDAIIAVGYRVNSKKATLFRRWATDTLKEYIVKGFVLNDEMLKNGKPFGKDYFDELLERIKEIRASERRFYQKVTDIYAQCSYDYDRNSDITQQFFKMVQNKLLFAITGKTAPELISDRADSKKEHMGLTTWKNAPEGKVLKSDVTVSKNYLKEDELKALNDIVNMYLDYAENQARRHKKMSMKEWAARLDAFLQFNEYEILADLGKVSRTVAESLAYDAFEKFRITQDEEYLSDFDKATEYLLKKE
jgi:hypothetical protein